MNIVVCCKLVPCVQDIEAKADGTLSFDRAEWQISDYDLQAVQAGVDIAAQTGGKLTALTVGTSMINTGKLKKDLLSRGPDELYIVADDSLEDAGTARISALLAGAVEKIGADLVICGDGSADYYYQQTGIQVGERLGWPSLNAIDKIDVEGERLVVERVRESGTDTLAVPLPAVLSVTSSINVPARPNMKAVLMAGKKPVTELSVQDTGAAGQGEGLRIVSTVAPEFADRKGVVYDGPAEEAVAELVRSLKTENALG